MPNDERLASLYRRLGTRPGPDAEGDGGADLNQTDDDFDTAVPAWIPDGRAESRRAWLAAVRAHDAALSELAGIEATP